MRLNKKGAGTALVLSGRYLDAFLRGSQAQGILIHMVPMDPSPPSSADTHAAFPEVIHTYLSLRFVGIMISVHADFAYICCAVVCSGQCCHV